MGRRHSRTAEQPSRKEDGQSELRVGENSCFPDRREVSKLMSSRYK